MPKYRALRELLLAEGVVAVSPSEEAPADWLFAAHSEAYVARCLNGELSAEEVRRLGMPWTPALVARARAAVFGTVQPLRGLSGAIRRYAYENYSEARAAHWLLLMLGDRVDVLESRVTAALGGRPDNVFAETGVRAEFRNRAYRTRFGEHRADLKHQPLDLILWAAVDPARDPPRGAGSGRPEFICVAQVRPTTAPTSTAIV